MRVMDAAREGMAVVEVTEEDAEGRTKWSWKIRRGEPSLEKPKKEAVPRSTQATP